MSIIPAFDPSKGNPLKELDDSIPKGIKMVQYPDNLENLDHWIRFSAKKREKAWRDSNTKATSLASIYLPIPSKLTTGYSQQYDNAGIGALGTLGAQIGTAARKVADSNKSVGSMMEAIRRNSPGANIEAWRKALSETGALAANFVLAGEGGQGGLSEFPIVKDIVNGVMFGTGVATNPHQAMLFNTVDFRTHSFAYQFAPKNIGESEMVKKIIYLFKFHSAPKFVWEGHNFFEYPDEFDIDFHYPNYLFTIAPSVLTKFSVDYSGSEQAAFFFGTHAPVHITITLDFTELTIVTKDRIESHGR